MRKIFIILVLIFSAVWGYTSWYWYTCKIKGICTLDTIEQETIGNTKHIDNSSKEEILKNVAQKSQILAANTIDPTSSTSEEITSETEVEVETPTPEATNAESVEECQDIVTTAIGLGAKNDALEVKALEQFLNTTQSGSLEVNGVYDQEDYEAVKKFQLTYKKEILDPWGIEKPTGYVYKTTIQKINEIHCKK